MRILVAGATGAIGRPLVRCLKENRRVVFALTRSPQSSRAVGELSAEPVTADALDAASVKAAIARVRPDAIINELTSLPRHYTAADRAHRTGTGPMAAGRHDRPGRRPDRRRDHSMAERSAAYRCRNPDNQPHRGRSARQLPGRQFRPAGAALVDRAVRRSSAQRAIGGLFHIFHPTRGGREGTERRPKCGVEASERRQTPPPAHRDATVLQ